MKRNYTTKSGDTYEWEETPEVIAALKKLHSGDYKGPLYAPHPDIKKQDDNFNYDTSGK